MNMKQRVFINLCWYFVSVVIMYSALTGASDPENLLVDVPYPLLFAMIAPIFMFTVGSLMMGAVIAVGKFYQWLGDS